MKNAITINDFYDYFNANLKVVPLNGDVSLIENWRDFPWTEVLNYTKLVDNWFERFGDNITGMAIVLGDANPGLASIHMNTPDMQICGRIFTEFGGDVIMGAGKKHGTIFYQNTRGGVEDSLIFKCPGNLGAIEVSYANKLVPLPPSWLSGETNFRWTDNLYTLLNTPINELMTLSYGQVTGIGELINAPTTDVANLNLPNDKQFVGSLKRKETIDALLNNIYKSNPHPNLSQTITEVLNLDALHYAKSSFFLGDTWKTANRDANALKYVSDFNSEWTNKTGNSTTFDDTIESETIEFNKLVPIDEVHEKLDQSKIPVFSHDLIPPIWRGMLEEISEGEGMSIQGLFMSMFTTLGACAQGNTLIIPKKNGKFSRRTNLATALVASSGSKKSDVIRIAAEEAYRIDEDKSHSNTREDLTRILDTEKKIETLTKLKGKSGEDIDALNAEIFRLQDELDSNPLKGTKFVYGNAPVQKMILDASRNQDTCLFMIKDEMKQIYADLKKKGNEDYRSFYMEGFDGNGKPFKYSTISRGDNFIKKHALSLLTAVQPDVISVYIKQLYSAYGENDGFLQRIILVPFGPPVITRSKDIDYRRFAKQYEVFRKAHHHQDIILHIDDSCMDLYDDLKEQIELKANRYYNDGPLCSVLSKHLGYLCVFAAIYEMINSEEIPQSIGADSLRSAMALLEWLGECAKHLFGIKDKQQDQDAVNHVAKEIVHRHFKDGSTKSEWYQQVRSNYKHPFVFYNALRDLELRGYVRITPTNKSSSERVWINPEVRLL